MKPFAITRRMKQRGHAFVLAALCSLAIPVAAEQIRVEPIWLARNCLDRGTADQPLSGKAFEACLNKKIEDLPPLDKTKRELFGERYDPAQYVKCRLQLNGRNNSACDVFVLRRRESVEVIPKGAKPPKWPHPPAKEVYRAHMAPKKYWENLCAEEAGDTVFQRAENVEGILNVRPRSWHSDLELRDRYVLEDPYSITDPVGDPKLESVLVQPYGGRYRFLEVAYVDYVAKFQRVAPTRSKPRFQTYANGRFVSVPYIVERSDSPDVAARYGTSWRGIRRPHDRENGIAGVEIALFDLWTGEILAFRRGFALAGVERRAQQGIWWMSSERCPDERRNSVRDFIYDVLQPIKDINVSIKPLEG